MKTLQFITILAICGILGYQTSLTQEMTRRLETIEKRQPIVGLYQSAFLEITHAAETAIEARIDEFRGLTEHEKNVKVLEVMKDGLVAYARTNNSSPQQEAMGIYLDTRGEFSPSQRSEILQAYK